MHARWVVSLVLLLVAVAIAVSPSELDAAVQSAQSLSPAVIVAVLAALFANAILASLRLKVIAGDVGHPLRLRDAIAAVSAGSIAGAAFFQIVGQLMARGTVLSRQGVAFPAIVIMTGYERAVAAAVSAALAVAGAYYIFGHILIVQDIGGATFIKIVTGLLVTGISGAVFGYGHIAARAIRPLVTPRLVARLARTVLLSLGVQAPTMIGYVAAAHALSPAVPLADLAAATAIVMFAASVPISLAGWGVREMSAVAALGGIGISAGKAFTIAVMIGIGSLAVMAMLAALTSRERTGAAAHPATERIARLAPAIDHAKALAWAVPLAAATLVFFQIHIPIDKGHLNVNLADPVALLGAALFLLLCRNNLTWRLSHINASVIAATATLTLSLIIGFAEFGWTTWAVANRFAGWFVLLSFAATAGLIVRYGGVEALRCLLFTFAATATAVVCIDLALVYLKSAGFLFPPGIVDTQITGFAQNPNALAFQLLMALAAAIAAFTGRTARIAVIGILEAGLWLTGSRAGWIALPLVLAAALMLRAISLKEVAISLIVATGLALGSTVLAFVAAAHGSFGAITKTSFAVAVLRPPEEASAAEHLKTLQDGWRLFLEQPVFGAGLGAYMRSQILATGRPLVIHSSPLWLLAETGLVGFLVFVAAGLRVLILEIRRPAYDIAAKLIVLSLIAFGTMSAVHDLLYQRSLWLVLGAALAHRWTLAEAGRAVQKVAR